MSFYDRISPEEMEAHIERVNRWLWFLFYEVKYREVAK